MVVPEIFMATLRAEVSFWYDLSICKVVYVTCKSPSWFVYAPRETSPVSFPWFLLSMHFGNVTDKFKDLFYQLINSCAILFD